MARIVLVGPRAPFASGLRISDGRPPSGFFSRPPPTPIVHRHGVRSPIANPPLSRFDRRRAPVSRMCARGGYHCFPSAFPHLTISVVRALSTPCCLRRACLRRRRRRARAVAVDGAALQSTTSARCDRQSPPRTGGLDGNDKQIS
uniref:Uncharacterized protein n=1 Tax=Plectus sambesii TaxID=2011161 RepID=A0A914VRN8_9BILA